MATKGSTRIPQSGGRHIFSLRLETAYLGLETRANSSPNPVRHEPRSGRGRVLTFYDAALRFVTSRRQNRGGTGGRPGLFLAKAASEGMGGKPAPQLPLYTQSHSTTSSKCWISSGCSAIRSRLTGSQNRRRFCANSRRISRKAGPRVARHFALATDPISRQRTPPDREAHGHVGHCGNDLTTGLICQARTAAGARLAGT